MEFQSRVGGHGNDAASDLDKSRQSATNPSGVLVAQQFSHVFQKLDLVCLDVLTSSSFWLHRFRFSIYSSDTNT